jgi:hypothetical protein
MKKHNRILDLQFYVFCRSLFCCLVLFLSAIVLSVLLRFTDSDYPLWYLQALLLRQRRIGLVRNTAYKSHTLYIKKKYRFSLFFVFVFVVWCLTPLTTIFQVYRFFIVGGNRSTRRKPHNIYIY